MAWMRSSTSSWLPLEQGPFEPLKRWTTLSQPGGDHRRRSPGRTYEALSRRSPSPGAAHESIHVHDRPWGHFLSCQVLPCSHASSVDNPRPRSSSDALEESRSTGRRRGRQQESSSCRPGCAPEGRLAARSAKVETRPAPHCGSIGSMIPGAAVFVTGHQG